MTTNLTQRSSIVEARNVRFGYTTGDFELAVPRLHVEPGEAVGIVGPSGSGKTTLIHLLAGILTPASGTIRLAGLDLDGLSSEDRQDLRILRVGLVFQEFELLEYLDVLDNVLLPYRISPVLQLDAEARARALDLIGRVGLDGKERRRPSELSQGERQRVAVARAIVTAPAIVFGDEPTGNLDPGNRDQVMDILARYSEETDAPLVLVSHDPELLTRFDRTLDVRSFV